MELTIFQPYRVSSKKMAQKRKTLNDLVKSRKKSLEAAAPARSKQEGSYIFWTRKAVPKEMLGKKNIPFCGNFEEINGSGYTEFTFYRFGMDMTFPQ